MNSIGENAELASVREQSPMSYETINGTDLNYLVQPPRPGSNTFASGERISKSELMTTVDRWVDDTTAGHRVVIQGGNRYVSEYILALGEDYTDMKLMSIEKAPLSVQLLTLLSDDEKDEELSESTFNFIAQSQEDTGLIHKGMTRGEVVSILAGYSVPGPFKHVTDDSQLSQELDKCIEMIETIEERLPSLALIQAVLRGTRLAEILASDKPVHFIDDLFYRGRTLFTLAVVLKAFGGTLQKDCLSTIGCDPKSRALESPYHKVLLPNKLYPFENSVSTELGYWQQSDRGYAFIDLREHSKQLYENFGGRELNTEVFTVWEELIREWCVKHQIGVESKFVTDKLPGYLLWFKLEAIMNGNEVDVDRLVDQKGSNSGPSVSFAHILDNFISQEEPVDNRLEFKEALRIMIAQIDKIIKTQPDELESLLKYLQEHLPEINILGINKLVDGSAETTNTLQGRNVVEFLTQEIAELSEVNECCVVGVSGVDTSGKTTLSSELKSQLEQSGLRVTEIQIDDFSNDSEVRHTSDNPILNYLEHTFNIKKLKQLIATLARDQSDMVILEHINPVTGMSYLKSYDVRPDVILVEGVFLFGEELVDEFDYKVHIDLAIGKMLSRAIERDVPKLGIEVVRKYLRKYMPAQWIYEQNARPKEIADVIVDAETGNFVLAEEEMV